LVGLWLQDWTVMMSSTTSPQSAKQEIGPWTGGGARAP
jgi:hypothetical protein